MDMMAKLIDLELPIILFDNMLQLQFMQLDFQSEMWTDHGFGLSLSRVLPPTDDCTTETDGKGQECGL